MDYNLGVIGLGHWFNRLNDGIESRGGLSLKKAVGTRKFEEKAAILESFGISKSNYYLSEPSGSVPSAFYDGLDVVHISDPNKFHALQTKESLSNGKYTIVEKTLAVTEPEFKNICSYIKKNKYYKKVYLHLHYIHKKPTTEIKKSLPELVEKYGKIKNVLATFFEKENEEDSKRGWLFGPENGGIFMDWIHPFEILYYATNSKFNKIERLEKYQVNSNFSKTHATGIAVSISLEGKYYKNDATAEIKVAKGTGQNKETKAMKILFDSGATLNLFFNNAETESKGAKRGTMEIMSLDNSGNQMHSTKTLTGPTTSEIFVDEILKLCKGENIGLNLEDIKNIFKPQWEYQVLEKSKELITDKKNVENFINSGIKDVHSTSN